MSTPTDSELPGHTALLDICAAFGANPTDARLLHHRSNAVWLLPHDNLIARLAPDTDLRRQRATTAVTVTRWLAGRDQHIALAPAHGQQPLRSHGAVATLWPYRPSTRPNPAALGALVRRLHDQPVPPFPLPRYQPLNRLREALSVDEEREQPALDSSERSWLKERIDAVLGEFATTDFPLGYGLVHGDVHDENAVYDQDSWVLIDWDGCCLGPRELDLVSTLPDHFHQDTDERREFIAAYGRDLMDWPGWTLLRDLTELHSLGSYIRLAPTKPAAEQELHHRIRSLRSGDREAIWHAVA
ncbi:aminoglycoside phosphotransferase family protein [Nocardia sp. 2]|uniref:Aminoglycoside phosphotransferase family protein n=1 Tax=Nocardia acididurans TaxID=2802282 RepID=A0ABS1MI40_9NOCA|nr:aminoglycoside phosphotransferase family protein [Nocardia acididurans]MBL1080249.1 aminoglycoside phosphotransferase family protein [Nocardia acididurans]